jgi:HK97 family phage portal protein
LLGTIVDKAPVPLVSRSAALAGGRQYASPRGQQAQLRAYGSNGTLFGIVSRTSTATAAVGWRLYRKAKSGKLEDRVEVTSHACIDLWNTPNPFFTQRLLIETEQQHLDLTGEGWLVIARNPRMKTLPLELWPVPPHRMRPVVSPTEYLVGYIYTSPDGEEVPLAIDDVIQMRMPDPDNMYRGLGPVQALMRTLDTQRFSEDWNKNFFANGAEPGGIIEVEERLGDDEFQEFRDRWAEAHQGVDNAHRVAILENKMKWVDRKYTARDMQFVELSRVGDEKLLVAYGISKTMLGMTEGANRAIAESGKVMFAEYLTVPRLDRFKDMLNLQLLPKYGPTGEGLEWDYDNPVPPDAEARDRERTSKAGAAAALVTAGFTGESVVEALDLPDSLKWEKPEPPAPAFGAGPPGGGKPAPKPAAPAVKPKSVLELSWLNAAAPEPVQVDDPELQQVQDDWEAALAALLIVWAGISAAQQAELLAQITAAIAAGTVVALAALVVSTTAAATVLSAAMGGMAATAAKQMVKEAQAQGKKLPVPKAFPDLKPVAETVAELLGQGLAQAAGREAVRVYAPGVTPEQVAEQVGEHLSGLSDAYLREQLGAAMTRAQNVARLETVKDVPQTIYAAEETLDRNTCKPCKDINGTVFDTWLDAWKAYAGGTYHACLGRNRCRGTVKATWNEAAG